MGTFCRSAVYTWEKNVCSFGNIVENHKWAAGMSTQTGHFCWDLCPPPKQALKEENTVWVSYLSQSGASVETSIPNGFLHVTDSTALSLLSYPVDSGQVNKGPDQAACLRSNIPFLLGFAAHLCPFLEFHALLLSKMVLNKGCIQTEWKSCFHHSPKSTSLGSNCKT